MKRKIITISIILIFIFAVVVIMSCFRRNAGGKYWEKYFEIDSVWEYENEEECLKITLYVTKEGAEAEYRYKEKQGKWSFGVRVGNGRWSNISFGYIKDDSVMEVWSGTGKIEKDQITIKDIQINEYLHRNVKSGAFPKEIESETIADTIKKIELKRVK